MIGNNKPNFLHKFDLHPKTRDEYRIRTLHGAAVSVVALCLVLYLFSSELSYAFKTEVVDNLFVNSTRGQELPITFNITFPRIACSLLSADVMDTMGNKQPGVRNEVYRVELDTDGVPLLQKRIVPLGDTIREEHDLTNHTEVQRRMVVVRDEDQGNKDQDGEECGDCYGAGNEGECCNTCDDVKLAYKRRGWAFMPAHIVQCKGEVQSNHFDSKNPPGGCNIYGTVHCTKMSGDLHFAPSKHMAPQIMGMGFGLMQFLEESYQAFNITHTIHHLSFGEQYPGIVNPLDGRGRLLQDVHGMYQYYIKVVPTVYKFLNGTTVSSNQYSVTEHLRHVRPGSGRGLPGIFFFYETSPIQAEFEEKQRGMFQLLTSVCAIVGGVVTVLGVLDSFIFKITKTIMGERSKTQHVR